MFDKLCDFYSRHEVTLIAITMAIIIALLPVASAKCATFIVQQGTSTTTITLNPGDPDARLTLERNSLKRLSIGGRVFYTLSANYGIGAKPSADKTLQLAPDSTSTVHKDSFE